MLRKDSDPLDERDRVCALSEHRPRFHFSGEVTQAHILDRIFCTPSELHDPANKIYLRADLHRIWDQREFNILCDGSIQWSRHVSNSELSRLGISRDSRLHYSLLTKERIAYLNRREQNYGAFRQKADLAMQAEREQKQSSQRLGIPHEEGASNRDVKKVPQRRVKLRI